jgi:hypothetical protein
MAKLLNTTFLVTQSAPATPSSGFGTLFASSSKLYFKNTSGTTYDLTTATRNGVIYPSLDPSIFEVKFLNRDIKGRVVNQ